MVRAPVSMCVHGVSTRVHVYLCVGWGAHILSMYYDPCKHPGQVSSLQLALTVAFEREDEQSLITLRIPAFFECSAS